MNCYQLGVHMDETNFTFRGTQQAVQERQLIELSTAGRYEIQRIHLAVNLSEVGESTPMFTVEWGGRESGPFSLLESGS